MPETLTATGSGPRRTSARVSSRSQLAAIAATRGIIQFGQVPEQPVVTKLVQILPSLSPQSEILCNLVPHKLWLTPRGTCSVSNPYMGCAGLEDWDKFTDSLPHVRYRALSYLWGDEQDLKTIRVNGEAYLIKSNLYDFMECARNSPELRDGWWWIDAPSIDQSNIAERNHQVKSMGLIYSYAHVVVSWLGKNLDTFDLFFESVQEFEEILDKEFPGFECAFYGAFDDYRSIEHIAEKVCRKRQLTLDNWYKFHDQLMGLEYWHRAWVAQELELSSRCWILTASVRTTLRALALCAQTIIRKFWRENGADAFLSLETNHGLVHATECATAKTVRGMYESRGLAKFATASRLQCSESKDRIFSQLSLIKDGGNFPVDYAEDQVTLLLRTLLFCYPSGKDTEPLHQFSDWFEITRGLSVSLVDILESLQPWLASKVDKSSSQTVLLMALIEKRLRLTFPIHDPPEPPPSAYLDEAELNYTTCEQCAVGPALASCVYMTVGTGPSELVNFKFKRPFLNSFVGPEPSLSISCGGEISIVQNMLECLLMVLGFKSALQHASARRTRRYMRVLSAITGRELLPREGSPIQN